jgi:uncharacterized membrane protein YhaH (DUF805 family)
VLYVHEEMKNKESKLPPFWIKVFSWLFLVFLVIPVLAFWQIKSTGTQLGISAFGLELKGNEDPLGWMIAVDAVLFLAAISALSILTKRRYAYDLSIFYCVFALAVTIPALFLLGDRNAVTLLNIAIQFPLLICFLIHLWKNRNIWRETNVNQSEISTPFRAPRSTP